MTSLPDSGSARVGRGLGRIALAVGIVCAVAALAAGPAYRTGVAPLGAALQAIRWSAIVAVGGAVAALIAALLSMARPSVGRGRCGVRGPEPQERAEAAGGSGR